MAKKIKVLGKLREVKSSTRNRRLAAEYMTKAEGLASLGDQMEGFNEGDEIAAVTFLVESLTLHANFIGSIFKLTDQESESLEELEDSEVEDLAVKIIDIIFFGNMSVAERKQAELEGKK